MKKTDHLSVTEYKALKTEHQIQTECINFLRASGYFVQRMNAGVIHQANEQGKTRRILMGRRGTPDIMAFKEQVVPVYGMAPVVQLLFIEVKRPGKKPTFNQEQMMQELTEYGAQCLVVHSVEELAAHV